jgi:hypothetical protein
MRLVKLLEHAAQLIDYDNMSSEQYAYQDHRPALVYSYPSCADFHSDAVIITRIQNNPSRSSAASQPCINQPHACYACIVCAGKQYLSLYVRMIQHCTDAGWLCVPA